MSLGDFPEMSQHRSPCRFKAVQTQQLLLFDAAWKI